MQAEQNKDPTERQMTKIAREAAKFTVQMMKADGIGTAPKLRLKPCFMPGWWRNCRRLSGKPFAKRWKPCIGAAKTSGGQGSRM